MPLQDSNNEDDERTRIAPSAELTSPDGDAADATVIQPNHPHESENEATPVLSARPAESDNDATRTQPVSPAEPGNEATVIASQEDRPTVVQPSISKDTFKPTITIPGIAKSLLDTLAGENLTASSSLAPDQELSVGVVIKDRFVLKEELGRGGMGTVFKALDLRKVEANDREAFVALKVLNIDFRDNPVSLIALQRETKRAQTLSHPNIITVYDFDRDGAQVFMTMEHLQGRPLSNLIRELPPGGMGFKRAWPIMEGMCAALAYAHKKNIVHSDFKPGNVFITGQNEAKVLDFGIATAIGRSDKGGADTTVFNARDLGAMTPAYARLEQIRDQAPDARDDIYALACVCYELLAGQHPFRKLSAENASELNLHPKPIAGLKRSQWKALQRGLAFKQEDRIKSVEEFAKLLQPHGKLFYTAWAAGVLVATITGANIYLHSISPPPAPPPIVQELTPEQKLKIKDMLELAEIHFDVGYLTAPTGSNALWAYREVLKIDPYDEKAITGIKKIADAEEQAAWELYEKGERAQSLKKVMEGLDADPRHEGLLKLKGKLEGS